MPWVSAPTNVPGFNVWVYNRDVPRISSALLDCVIYLYESRADADRGVALGGSGFLFPMEYDESCSVKGVHVYAVTNAHLLPKFPVIRFRNRKGEAVTFSTTADAWFRHPDCDDLTVCLLDLDAGDAIRLISPRYPPKRPHPPWTDDEGDFLGRDVVMVGRFMGHDGKETNAPALRFGNVAALPVEPIYHPQFGINQESFLVEGRSLPGYSGSPVFLLPDVWEQVRADPLRLMLKSKWRRWFGDEAAEQWRVNIPSPVRDARDLTLLGVVWCHLSHPLEPVVDRNKNAVPEGFYTRAHTGMAGVVPYWKVWEIFNGEEQRTLRKSIEDEATQRASGSAAVLD